MMSTEAEQKTGLGDMTWPEAQDRAEAGAVLVVPIGSTEQHGPHLPLSTDTDIALALCDKLGDSSEVDVVIAPTIAYGSSGEHEKFSGTISIGQNALELLIVEVCRSATASFDRVLLVSAHGGNVGPVQRATTKLQGESRAVRSFIVRCAGDAHAGHTETSIQLALHPQRVHMDKAVVGNTSSLGELMPTLRTSGVGAVSDSGILGDPTRATAGEGAVILDQLATNLLAELASWSTESGSP